MDLVAGYGSSSDEDNEKEAPVSKRAKVGDAPEPDASAWDSWGYYPQKQEDGEETYVISVPIQSQFVGRVIGKGGVRIKRLKTEAGAKCSVDKAPTGSTWAWVTLTGTWDSLLKAQGLVSDFLTVESSVPLDPEEMMKDARYKVEVCKAWLNNPTSGCRHTGDTRLCYYAHGLKDQRKLKKPREKKGAKSSTESARPKDVLYDWRTVDKSLHGWDSGGMCGTDGQYR